MTTVTVGLTPSGRKALEALRSETPWFNSNIDAYRFAIAYGLSEGLVTPASGMKDTTTAYNVGSLDGEQRIASLVRILGDQRDQSEDVYRYAERVADAGLSALKEELIDKKKRLEDILEMDAG